MDRFEVLFERFGTEDQTIWVVGLSTWCRERIYDDGAWLASRKVEPVEYWGA
jgi:hypothetical protein